MKPQVFLNLNKGCAVMKVVKDTLTLVVDSGDLPRTVWLRPNQYRTKKNSCEFYAHNARAWLLPGAPRNGIYIEFHGELEGLDPLWVWSTNKRESEEVIVDFRDERVESESVIDRKTPVLHSVRGHQRHLRSGKVVWVRPHHRGRH